MFISGLATIWFRGSPLSLIAIVLKVPPFNGFHSTLGWVYMKLFLKQGANGPFEFPGIQVFELLHHPHPGLLTQLLGWLEWRLQLTWTAFILFLPS